MKVIYDVFSVHDVKADAFLPPFILPKQSMAIRVFSDCINSPDHQFGRHPADYTLFRLGSFDDENGQFLLERTKHSLGNGVEFVQDMDVPSAKEGSTNGKTHPSEQKISNGSSVLDGPSGPDSAE